MAVGKISLRMAVGLALVSVAMVSLTCAYMQNSTSGLAREIDKAERILIGTPEKDVDVAGGESFLVEINRVVRGAGKKGQLARIFNSGDKEHHPRFKGGQAYVFLLTKNPAGKGWLNLGTSEITVADDQVQYVVDGKVQEKVTLDEFDKLVARHNAAGGAASQRESLAGRWLLTLSRRGSDFSIWLLELTANGKGGFDARIIETSRAMEASTLKHFEIGERDVRLELIADEDRFDFRGTFDAGIVRGSVLVGEGMIVPARLVATDAKSIKRFEEPQPSDGREDFIEAASQEDSFADLLAFVRRHGESPLALDAYQDLISQAKGQKYDKKQFTELADAYLNAARKWGPRFEARAYLDLGVTLSRTDYLNELALDYLTKADQQISGDVPSHWKLLVGIEKGKQLLAGDNPNEGLELLRGLRTANPFDPDITWLLARDAEKGKRDDEALALYGELAALPMMERSVIETVAQSGKRLPRDEYPSRVFSRLWKARHGDTKGLDKYFEEVYEQKLREIAGKKHPPRKAGEGTRVSLCELFTGSDCPPCLGADAATTALEAAYDKSEVIVLRYHQHTPGPDPLANDDSQDRFTNYDGEGTPTIFVNGKPFENAGGFMPQVPDIYTRLRKAVDPYLGEKLDLKIELSADAKDGNLAISAKATGLKSFPEDVRLRLVLAEDRIHFEAGNGIRVHEMVVRSMPGGVEGIEPEKGQLAYRGNVELARLKSQLSQHLRKIENTLATEFPEKPMDLKALHLVAFLQNDDTGEVLQAAAIPVAGSVSAASGASKPAVEKTARSKAPVGTKN